MKKMLLSVLLFTLLFTGVAFANSTYPLVGNYYKCEVPQQNGIPIELYFGEFQITTQAPCCCYGPCKHYEVHHLIHEFDAEYYCGANGGPYTGVAYINIHYPASMGGDSGWMHCQVWEDGSEFILNDNTSHPLVFNRI